MIIVLPIRDFCYPKPTHWHHLCPWWLIKKGGCQGVTGRTRFTCHWPELIIIMFSVVILIVLVIQAKKIVHFQLSLVLKVPLVFSVSAISAREENDSPALDVIFSAIIRSILTNLFSLGPPHAGVLHISVGAVESTAYVCYRRFFKCSDLYCTPGIPTPSALGTRGGEKDQICQCFISEQKPHLPCSSLQKRVKGLKQWDKKPVAYWISMLDLFLPAAKACYAKCGLERVGLWTFFLAIW